MESGTTICEVKRMIEDKDVDLKGTLLIFAGKPLISCNPTPPCARKCGTQLIITLLLLQRRFCDAAAVIFLNVVQSLVRSLFVLINTRLINRPSLQLRHSKRRAAVLRRQYLTARCVTGRSQLTPPDRATLRDNVILKIISCFESCPARKKAADVSAASVMVPR